MSEDASPRAAQASESLTTRLERALAEAATTDVFLRRDHVILADSAAWLIALLTVPEASVDLERALRQVAEEAPWRRPREQLRALLEERQAIARTQTFVLPGDRERLLRQVVRVCEVFDLHGIPLSLTNEDAAKMRAEYLRQRVRSSIGCASSLVASFPLGRNSRSDPPILPHCRACRQQRMGPQRAHRRRRIARVDRAPPVVPLQSEPISPRSSVLDTNQQHLHVWSELLGLLDPASSYAFGVIVCHDAGSTESLTIYPKSQPTAPILDTSTSGGTPSDRMFTRSAASLLSRRMDARYLRRCLKRGSACVLKGASRFIWSATGWRRAI